MDKLLQTFGLNRSCSIAEIKSAYHKLAKIKHPDHGGTTEQFIALQKSYEWLLANHKHFNKPQKKPEPKKVQPKKPVEIIRKYYRIIHNPGMMKKWFGSPRLIISIPEVITIHKTNIHIMYNSQEFLLTIQQGTKLPYVVKVSEKQTPDFFFFKEVEIVTGYDDL